MIELSKRIEAFDALGTWLEETLKQHQNGDSELTPILHQAFVKNGWFAEREVLKMLHYWASELRHGNLSTWVEPYEIPDAAPKSVLLVLAGNIPLVGFHDVLTTIISGNKALIKCSSSDNVLLPFLLSQLARLQPEMDDTFNIQEGISKNFDAVMATGSNNSSRHFEQYFSSVPSVIRRNRTSVAILDGDETPEQLSGLMHDAFQYFGLGCRSVTSLMLPEGYDLNKIFEASIPFSYMMDNKKYVNNYAYHKAVMMLERKNVLENELILMLESEQLFSPVSVLHYSHYKNAEELSQRLEQQLDNIQCVVGNKNTPFGKAQKPRLGDYADGVDTLEFLVNL